MFPFKAIKLKQHAEVQSSKNGNNVIAYTRNSKKASRFIAIMVYSGNEYGSQKALPFQK